MVTLLELIDKLIREHGSASILKDHLELVREKAKNEIAELERKHARVVEKLHDENSRLEAKLAELEQAERCPFCGKTAVENLHVVPHENPDFAEIGQKQMLCKCANCEKEFRKDV